MGFLGRFEGVFYALFRILIGLFFATHGAQKVFGILGGPKAGAPLFLIGGWIELITGLLIAIGLFTGLAAFLASGEMAFAYFLVHASGGFWPVLNKGELAVVYCFAFLYMAAHGGGIWSLDAMRSGGATASPRFAR
jgi:putative oxidoreductase